MANRELGTCAMVVFIGFVAVMVMDNIRIDMHSYCCHRMDHGWLYI